MHRFFLTLNLLFFFNSSYAQDWANLNKYKDSNAIFNASKKNRDLVIFMGNSIFESWSIIDPDFFKMNNFLNRGISGQTTPQMLLRFRQDVIKLNPKIVVILAGTNDIAGNTGVTTLENIQDNILSMVELANENKIKVILCSLLPVKKYKWAPSIDPIQKVISLNNWIKKYCDNQKILYVDFYSSLVSSDLGMIDVLSNDGVHPNLKGYKIMEPLLLKAIRKIRYN